MKNQKQKVINVSVNSATPTKLVTSVILFSSSQPQKPTANHSLISFLIPTAVLPTGLPLKKLSSYFLMSQTSPHFCRHAPCSGSFLKKGSPYQIPHSLRYVDPQIIVLLSDILCCVYSCCLCQFVLFMECVVHIFNVMCLFIVKFS